MMHEVRSIPPAPRRVRLRPLLAHRWPLLTIGGFLAGFGLLVSWAMFLQSGGKFSLGPTIDRGPTTTVKGTLTHVSEPRTIDGAAWQAVDYTFVWVVPPDPSQPDHVPLFEKGAGTCLLPLATRRVGDVIDVQVLDQKHEVNRVVGGMLHIDRDWLRARFWIGVMVVPGCLLLLRWLAGAMQLRHVLVHGDVSVGHVTRVMRVPLVMPEMLSVRYEFVDHRAIRRSNRHWVRARGELGERLRGTLDGARPEPLPVLHDRRHPQWSRILLPGDYLPSPVTDPLPMEGSP